MQSLTEDLLDLARLENNRIRLVFTSVLLQDLIHDVVRMNQPGWEVKPIHLKLDLPANPITVMADSRRLKQVITNLLANAFNYTPQGGYVTLQLQVENECAVITIADSGVGIAPEHLPHLFDPFFRANENSNGTGLGLSITREIVHLHNGEISVESELGHGSRFIVRIPLTSGDALSHDNQPL
jgi:signal transduction histidine kinase